ncbi:MAG: RNA 2',3'-cyclic phosphodiesterase [Methanomicrobiaceae archaeon]|nr:RNA 2',3'-cyclic phosphodiesterase [Methanomicrobiaceae archaeon]
MVRAFIAIDMPGEIRTRIAKAQAVLAKSDAKLTPVNPSITHITLKFLGEVDARTLESVEVALGTLSFHPFDMTISGVSGNSVSRPRVIWATAQDDGMCSKLARRIEEILAPIGIQRERRQFTPHITIARVRRFDTSLSGRIDELASTSFGNLSVSAVRLKKSTLTPSGPVYETLMEVTL